MKRKGKSRRINLGYVLMVGTILSVFLLPRICPALDYPTKPIQLVVGMAAGGPADVSTRIIGEEARKELGVPVVVTNKPGAAGSTAAALIARAKPDGYTILVGGSWSCSAVWAFLPDTPYKLSDFIPIARYITLPVVIAVRSEAPWNTFKDFVEDAKSNPGKFKSGSDGGGSSLAWEAVLKTSNIQVAHVVYKGGAPNSTALLGGHVDISSVAYTPILPHIEAKKVRLLASVGHSKLKEFPNIPSFAELGHPQASREFWHGLLTPAGTPQPVVEKLSETVRKVMSNPSIHVQLEKIGVIPGYQGPKEFGEFLQKEYEAFMLLGKKYKIPE